MSFKSYKLNQATYETTVPGFESCAVEVLLNSILIYMEASAERHGIISREEGQPIIQHYMDNMESYDKLADLDPFFNAMAAAWGVSMEMDRDDEETSKAQRYILCGLMSMCGGFASAWPDAIPHKVKHAMNAHLVKHYFDEWDEVRREERKRRAEGNN